ncbi:MAG: hypothetical protein KQ78_00018 [Candidatus Izimaplasma bacterium HR2]|nr:MAG: hypothetical protein KQ78_00018 [Candidatus Izimaplasma bacterium HR2]
MKQFEGYIDPNLAQFLVYDGPNLSTEIGDKWKEIELKSNKKGVIV